MQGNETDLNAFYRGQVRSLLKSTKRPGVENLIEFLENSDFYYAPASTIYHGSFKGGLVQHVLNVYNAIQYEYSGLAETDFNTPEIPEESLIIVSICHDLCKINTYHEGFRWSKDDNQKWEKIPTYKREPDLPMGHGGKSVYLAQKYIDLTDQEAQAIFWHMGPYDISNYMTLNELSQTFNDNLLAYLLNKADMTATYIMENENYK